MLLHTLCSHRRLMSGSACAGPQPQDKIQASGVTVSAKPPVIHCGDHTGRVESERTWVCHCPVHAFSFKHLLNKFSFYLFSCNYFKGFLRFCFIFKFLSYFPRKSNVKVRWSTPELIHWNVETTTNEVPEKDVSVCEPFWADAGTKPIWICFTVH